MKKLLLILLCLPMFGFGQTSWTPCDSSFSISINSQDSMKVVYSVSGPNFNMNSNFSWVYFNMIGQCIGGSNSVASHIDTLNALNINNITDSTAIMCLISDSISSCIVVDTLVYDSLSGWSLLSAQLSSSQTYVPDDNFEQALINLGYDTFLDDNVATSSIDTVTYLNIDNQDIFDLTGIEDFISLIFLNCKENQLSSLDLTQNTQLSSLNFGFNQITNIDLTNNILLASLICDSNQISNLNLSNNSLLQTLICRENQISQLNISNLNSLVYLDVYDNQIIQLDISQNSQLTSLMCAYNQLNSLDVSNNSELNILHCGQNPISNLDISQNINLTSLNCANNQLSEIDVSQNYNLTYLSCVTNQIDSLDLSSLTVLEKIFCYSNQLKYLDLRNGNNINFTSIDITNNDSLDCINVDNSSWSNTNWTFLDGEIDSQHFFSNNCSGITSIQENTTHKKILKIIDLLGRETKQTNQPLLYLYDDGTVEKRIVIE